MAHISRSELSSGKIGRLCSLQQQAPPLPCLAGKEVVWIADIRNAPGGLSFDFTQENRRQSELIIKVQAAATDQFTLYLEGALDGENEEIFGGIHLDAAKREAEEMLSLHFVKFVLPFNKWTHISLSEALVEAVSCPMSKLPNIVCSIANVFQRQKREDHNYRITYAWMKDNKLCLNVKHPYPVVQFTLECEPWKEEEIVQQRKYGESPALNAELIAMADHSEKDCTCARKSKMTSTLEFDLAQFKLEKKDQISIWGPHDTQFFEERELTVFAEEDNAEYL